MNARLRAFSLIAALVIGGVALIGSALWFVGPTLALIAFFVAAVVIVPSCIEILREHTER